MTEQQIAEVAGRVLNQLWPILGGNALEAHMWQEINDAVIRALADQQQLDRNDESAVRQDAVDT